MVDITHNEDFARKVTELEQCQRIIDSCDARISTLIDSALLRNKEHNDSIIESFPDDCFVAAFFATPDPLATEDVVSKYSTNSVFYDVEDSMFLHRVVAQKNPKRKDMVTVWFYVKYDPYCEEENVSLDDIQEFVDYGNSVDKYFDEEGHTEVISVTISEDAFMRLFIICDDYTNPAAQVPRKAAFSASYARKNISVMRSMKSSTRYDQDKILYDLSIILSRESMFHITSINSYQWEGKSDDVLKSFSGAKVVVVSGSSVVSGAIDHLTSQDVFVTCDDGGSMSVPLSGLTSNPRHVYVMSL